jgi:hypothetical protein
MCPSYSTSSTKLAVLVEKAISYGFTFTVGSFCVVVHVCVCGVCVCVLSLVA